MVFHDLWASIPPITRSILLIQFFLSLSVTLELCTPFKLYFNYNLIKRKYQVRNGFNSSLSNGII